MARLLRFLETLFKIPETTPQRFSIIFHFSDDMGTLISLAFDGRRRAPRHHVRQIGMILAQPGRPVCYCLVMDTSERGVRIRTRSDFQAPSEFVMRLRNIDRRYSLVWREGFEMGAKLVG